MSNILVAESDIWDSIAEKQDEYDVHLKIAGRVKPIDTRTKAC
jgi:hypothetical protein